MREQRERREAAAGANEVMAPIARRKLRKEAQQVRMGSALVPGKGTVIFLELECYDLSLSSCSKCRYSRWSYL